MSDTGWGYTPSCPCRQCEQERVDKGMTVLMPCSIGLSQENTEPHRGFVGHSPAARNRLMDLPWSVEYVENDWYLKDGWLVLDRWGVVIARFDNGDYARAAVAAVNHTAV